MATWIVENSAAPNAIGDSVASFPALHSLAWQNHIKVYLAAAKCRDLFYHPKAELLSERPETGKVLDIQQIYARYAHSGMSMTRAYLMAAGFPTLAQSAYVPEIHFNLDGENFPEKWDVLIAPFSASDFGTNTKVWPEENWLQVMEAVKKANHRIGILGTSGDALGRLAEFGEPILDRPLKDVCRLLRGSCRMLISTDNGIGWLAQGVGTNHVLLLPKTHHPNWTANPARNAINLTIDAAPQNVLQALNQLARG